MFRKKTVSTVLSLLCLAPALFGADTGNPLHLREALKHATEKVDSDDNSVQNARLELQMLEALGRTRVELRPQLSVLSFSNPIFLAASLGSSLSINRRTAPTPLNMELARFGVVEAELSHVRSRINAQVDTARYFFTLAESQDQAVRACNSWTARNREHSKVQTLVSLSRLTKIDSIRFEQDLTGLESDCVEAKAQSEAAALTLMRLVGYELPSEQFQIAMNDLAAVSEQTGLVPVTELVKAVYESQNEFGLISQHIAEFAGLEPDHRLHFDSLSTGYSYLKNATKDTGFDKKYLLGGNVGHFDTNFTISLRNTGDGKAMAAFLQARFDRLQHNFADLKRTVLYQIEDNQQRAALAAARLRLAQKKQRLADELQNATTQRVQVGLQGASDEMWATRDAIRAEAESARLGFEWKRSFFTVLALCDPQKLDVSTFLAKNASPSSGKAQGADRASVQSGVQSESAKVIASASRVIVPQASSEAGFVLNRTAYTEQAK